MEVVVGKHAKQRQERLVSCQKIMEHLPSVM